ncbi:hypothetical protein [uncultured Hymenobacter sp.]|uniref:hypothetical protein n=1 Tax=uncultured Hymenobacter sp. TaxID=170016 RepID=UPI0035C9A90A
MLTYSQVTFKTLREHFGIRVETIPFLPPIVPRALPDWLVRYLAINPLTPTISKSEKAVSEVLIAPVLSAVKEHYAGQIGVFSGEPLSTDELVGVCDFIITASATAPLAEPPIIVLVKAKRQNILSGVPQCAAEMLAARELNRQENIAYPAIYGCVTSGIEWAFLRLQQDLVQADPSVFNHRELEQVLGVFDYLLTQFDLKRQAV